MKRIHCGIIVVVVWLMTLGTLAAYDFEYDAGNIEGSKTSTGITYTLSVSKGNLGTSYDFDTRAGVTSGSPSEIDIDVTQNGATGTVIYANNSLPSSNFTISMNGKLIPPSGGSGGRQPTWGASGEAKAPFHIKSNQNDGAKEIVVPAGTSVTYTAYEGTSSKASNWTVNGQTKNNESSIIFNRSWWDVPGWFSASMGTPDPGIYNISARPTDRPGVSDSGSMTVIGVGSISGEGKTSTKNNPSEITNAETIWVDSTNSNSVSLTAHIAPSGTSWPADTPEWDASCGFWCLLGDHFSGNTTGQTTVNVATSSPDILSVWADCGSSRKYIKVIAYKVDFDISKGNLMLKHDNKSVFTVTADPSSVFTGASAPVVQIKRIGIGATTWMDLLNQTGNIDWYARVAGIFKLRLKTIVDGADFTTPEKDVTVNFPTYSQIIADSTVISRMASEWQATLDDCTGTPNQRRERGFWIELDTSGNGTYSAVNYFVGPYVGPWDGARVLPGSRPHCNLSSVSPIALGAKYAVAFFHTHTPTTYRSVGRPNNVSDSDNNFAIYVNTAGIAYDYTIADIPAGYPKNSPSTTFPTTLQQRLLNKE